MKVDVTKNNFVFLVSTLVDNHKRQHQKVLHYNSLQFLHLRHQYFNCDIFWDLLCNVYSLKMTQSGSKHVAIEFLVLWLKKLYINSLTAE